MPVPMMTPMPNTVRSQADSSFLSLCSDSSVSRIDCSIDLVRSTPMAGRLLHRLSAIGLYPARIARTAFPPIRSAPMADTRKPRTKPAPTGKSQPGRGSGTGTAAKARRQPDKGKLARGAAARRLEEKRRRQRTLLWSGVAVLALVALLAVIWFEGRSDTPAADNQSVSAAALEAGRTAAGSKGVQTFPEAGRDHISPGEQPDNWNSN